MARVLVILPTASYQVSDYVAAAEQLGVELALASEEAPPLGMEDRFVSIDCGDVESSAHAIADLAAATPVDSIVSADDAGVVIAARASELIGLPHNPFEAAAATRDKGLMRTMLGQAEVPQPAFGEAKDVENALRVASSIGWPVVLKPVGLSASRGVIRADDEEQLRVAVERVQRTFPSELADMGGRLLVEQFVPGREITVEGLVWSGELEVLTILDKPDPLDGPFFEETMFVAPTDLAPPVIEEVHRITQASIDGIGLVHGPVHAELRISDDRPAVIEIAARTIGGHCGRALTFGLLGYSLESLVLRQALGSRKRGMTRTPEATGAYMIPIPRAGLLQEVRGVDEARAVDGVWSVEISAPIGSAVAPPPDGDRYLGFIFARAHRRSDAVAALRRAAAHITVVVA
jgi:biotin carboxylase